MSGLKGIAVAPLLLSLQVAAAFADNIPKLDVDTTCNADAKAPVIPRQRIFAGVGGSSVLLTPASEAWRRKGKDSGREKDGGAALPPAA